jgi:hypothetical protein
MFGLQPLKQLSAGSPRLCREPCVQLHSDFREWIRSPAAALLFRLGPQWAALIEELRPHSVLPPPEVAAWCGTQRH